MTFLALAAALGGRPLSGYQNYYHIPEVAADHIRAHAGSAGTVEVTAGGGGIRLQFVVAEGTAVIVAARDETNVLRDVDMFLIHRP